ncbi:2-hydroxychromene-2-carboxylate isomerase [Plantactinospora sp. WMMC1484]|uniref:2-hydroxychromene-2-carboxylate isomerase n=1 Tax=Plantactinospora sp. WMMC1484 TaxID=3404122 RepID=UPI003BF5533F
MAVRRTPRFYFSLRSPYSWLAHRDLHERYPGLAAQLEWVPFWEPDELSGKLLAEAGGEFVYTPMSRAKHLYVLADVRRLGAQRGLSVTWPVDRDPVWEIPHLGYLVARRHGAGPAYVERAYRARWQEGRDICDRATVAGIAAELGLDPAEVSGAADDPEVRRQGVAALLDIHRDGVFGVPFFVHGFERFWGVDRLAAFAASVADRLGGGPSTTENDKRGPFLAPAAGRTDEGHAGGCG